MGILPSCPTCGIKNWISINEIKYKVECFGCRNSFLISAEEKWHYKLNTLFEMGYSRQGLCPVILVLGQLLGDARNSFLFTASLDIFNERDDSIYYDKKIKPVTDLDIVCILDGKFIIGEVKHNNKLFTKKDFDTMYEVALRIRPDKIIFSSMSEQPSELINKYIADLNDKLKLYKIEVEWYPLDSYIFEPSYVR
ncbi:MAG: hypothetical protein JSS63_14555 [Bacteroidetes bacterium]|nr:hypothetical protein [Bacteroidota bacterium]